MILQELRLLNFGLYRGEQVINLLPVATNGKRAPIILFGGMNGGGKTTLLDAVQLALYGQRAQCAKRAGRAYDQFLSETIHHGVSPQEGAAVALRFRYASDEGPIDFEVSRAWSVREGKARETLAVFKNREKDRWMSENWNQVVEDLIPLGLSQLFFFDAEKIRFLAEDETTSSTLGTAIKSLLGLDLAERLIADTTVLESRLARSTTTTVANDDIDQQETTLTALLERLSVLKSERASLENDLLRAERAVQDVEEEFANVGGKHWEQREQRKGTLKSIQDQRVLHHNNLQNIAGNELPMALVLPALNEVARSVQKESNARTSGEVVKALGERDSRLLDALKAEKVDSKTVTLIRNWLKRDLSDKQADEAPPVYLLSDSAAALLLHVETTLGHQLSTVRETLATLDVLERQIEDAERSIAAASNDAQIQPVVERLKTQTRQQAALLSQAAGLDREIADLQTEMAIAEQRLHKLRRMRVDGDIDNEQNLRIKALVERTRETMRSFLERSTINKIERLSRFVTESFRFLLRKTTLVERIEIDPISFRIHLVDRNGSIIPKERLSEGEKQLFAIALLWGLGRASTRPLPTIIDTPMGRLDSTHRDHLIERYFPNASHQVVILSTDTEVDRDFYEQLSPAIARAYHLNYSEVDRCTTAEEGYFWKLEANRNTIGVGK